MAQASKPKRGVSVLVLAIVLALAVLLIPGVAAAAGRLIGGLWVSTMGAVMGLLGGLIG
jgi:hypothetical protein